MSAVLIAVILALVLGHAAPQLSQLRRYEWFGSWLQWLTSIQPLQDAHASRFGILLGLAPPLLLVGVSQALLHDVGYGLPGFAFALLVLLYCWGPRDLESDVDAIAEAGDAERRQAAVAAVFDTPPLQPPTTTQLVDAVFRGALERWFGVLLWFVLLGPFGALLYRLTQLGATPSHQAMLPLEHGASFLRLKLILDWPAAQLMTIGLALAADFDAVVAAWRRWHEDRAQGWFVLDTGFLAAAARASVDIELAEDQDDAYVEAAPAATPAPSLSALRDAMSLVWRILLLWLAVLALTVLAGYVN